MLNAQDNASLASWSSQCYCSSTVCENSNPEPPYEPRDPFKPRSQPAYASADQPWGGSSAFSGNHQHLSPMQRFLHESERESPISQALYGLGTSAGARPLETRPSGRDRKGGVSSTAPRQEAARFAMSDPSYHRQSMGQSHICRLSGVVEKQSKASTRPAVSVEDDSLRFRSLRGGEVLAPGVYCGWAEVFFPYPDVTIPAAEILGPTRSITSIEASPATHALERRSASQYTRIPGHRQDLEMLSCYPMLLDVTWDSLEGGSYQRMTAHLVHYWTHDFDGARMNLDVAGLMRASHDNFPSGGEGDYNLNIATGHSAVHQDIETALMYLTRLGQS